ncbi:hypothetical protein ACW7GZ_01260 [Luteimonas sp. A537]
MNLKQIPLALALTLAIAAMAGCARDSTPAANAADAGAIEQVAHAEDEAHDAHDTAHDADHAHAAADALGVDFPVPDNHQPWAPDAPLIEGMSRVRTAVAGLEAHPDEATVIARASDVDDAVEYMFANCSLPTEPDIALHAILARLMAGTQALQENPADAAPVADMHGALENYRTLFDDPNS